MNDVNARDAKLIQYLNEAYGKERQLETALQAHIQVTTRAPYKKRLQEHLRETKTHAQAVQRRIKQLGGNAEATPVPGPGALSVVAPAEARCPARAAELAQWTAARDTRHERAREDAQERQDRVFGRARGDRQLHGHRSARQVGRRQ